MSDEDGPLSWELTDRGAARERELVRRQLQKRLTFDDDDADDDNNNSSSDGNNLRGRAIAKTQCAARSSAEGSEVAKRTIRGRDRCRSGLAQSSPPLTGAGSHSRKLKKDPTSGDDAPGGAASIGRGKKPKSPCSGTHRPYYKPGQQPLRVAPQDPSLSLSDPGNLHPKRTCAARENSASRNSHRSNNGPLRDFGGHQPDHTSGSCGESGAGSGSCLTSQPSHCHYNSANHHQQQQQQQHNHHHPQPQHHHHHHHHHHHTTPTRVGRRKSDSNATFGSGGGRFGGGGGGGGGSGGGAVMSLSTCSSGANSSGGPIWGPSALPATLRNQHLAHKCSWTDAGGSVSGASSGSRSSSDLLGSPGPSRAVGTQQQAHHGHGYSYSVPSTPNARLRRHGAAAGFCALEAFLPLCEIQAGLKKGEFFEGTLRMNPHCSDDSYISTAIVTGFAGGHHSRRST